MVQWQRPTDLEIVEFGGMNIGFTTMRVTSPFGDRDNPLFPEKSSQRTVFHGGLDIGNHRSGDLVEAAASGEVIAEGALREPWSMAAPASFGWFDNNYGGLMVVIDHGEGFVSIYAHMRKTIVSKGDQLSAGATIGEVGDTGSAKGQAHLHFGIQLRGDDVDPWPLIISGGVTREERLAREVLALRAAHPGEAAQWARHTGLTAAQDGKPLSRERRLSAEVTFLREVDSH